MSLDRTAFFAGITHDRFLAVPTEFEFRLDYALTAPTSERLAEIVDVASARLVETLAPREHCPLYNLKIVPKPQEGGEERLFVATFDTPIYGFALHISPTSLRITKAPCSLDDLIATVPLFEALAHALLGSDAAKASLLDLMRVSNRVYRCTFIFEQLLTLGKYLSDPTRNATNVTLASRLMKIDLPVNTADAERYAPLGALSPEQVLLGVATVGFKKTIGDRPRMCLINYKGPYNVVQKDVSLQCSMSTGEPMAPFMWADIFDWETPFVGFYRDLIINRFMPNLLFDIGVSPRF